MQDIFSGFLGLFVIAFIIFLVVRHFVVPKSFGEYGHYRGAAVDEIGALPVKFAGHQTCEMCHADVLATKSAGKHANVNCEACHGALADHANDPASVVPTLPDYNGSLCALSHRERGQARRFPAGEDRRSLWRTPLQDLPQSPYPRHWL